MLKKRLYANNTSAHNILIIFNTRLSQIITNLEARNKTPYKPKKNLFYVH